MSLGSAPLPSSSSSRIRTCEVSRHDDDTHPNSSSERSQRVKMEEWGPTRKSKTHFLRLLRGAGAFFLRYAGSTLDRPGGHGYTEPCVGLGLVLVRHVSRCGVGEGRCAAHRRGAGQFPQCWCGASPARSHRSMGTHCALCARFQSRAWHAREQ